jgi:hypothetical protein
MTPGLSPEALQALKDSKIKEVNRGLDKKYVSPGIEVNVDTTTLEVRVKGDIHLFPEEINISKNGYLSYTQDFILSGHQQLLVDGVCELMALQPIFCLGR